MTTRTVARSAAGMGAAAAVSRAFGAVRVLVIAAVLGTTYLGNTFQGSNQFSTVLFELLAAGALSAVLVPTFVEHLDDGDQSRAEQLAGGVLGVAMLVLGVVSVVGVLAAPWLAALLASGVADPDIAAQQEDLSTFLLRFFIPQLVLYAVGAVATAVLNAKRIFALPAAAPIANTVVVVGLLLVFRAVAGANPGLELDLEEKLLLAAAGTLGVAAFVAVPTVALVRGGFRLRPQLRRHDAGVRRLVGLGTWATVQHASAAVLLGTAIVIGGAVAGAVVAFQVGWFFFLGPYGIIAQPIQTAVQPELVAELGRDDRVAFGASLRWSLDTMAVLLLPVSAALVALALPIADVVAFGSARTGDGVELIAAAIASLGLGLLSYGAYLLLARAWYVLGDSRTPALVGLLTALAGAAAMVALAPGVDGAGLVALLGLAHTGAFTVAAALLGWGLARRVRQSLWPRRLPFAAGLAAAVGAGAWVLVDVWDPTGRLETFAALVLAVGVLGAGYLGVVRWCGILQARPGERSRVSA